MHAPAPFVVGRGDERFAISRRAPIVDAQHRVAAIREPLVHRIEAPGIAEVGTAVDQQHEREFAAGLARAGHVAVQAKSVARGKAHRLERAQRQARQRLALLEQRPHLSRLPVEQHKFAALGVAFEIGRQQPIAIAAAAEKDLACAVGGEVREILQGAGLDRVPAPALLFGPRRQRPACEEVDTRNVRLIVGREQGRFLRRHVHCVQRGLVAPTRVEQIERLAVGAELEQLGAVEVAQRYGHERRPGAAGVALEHFRRSIGCEAQAEPELKVAVGEKCGIFLVLVEQLNGTVQHVDPIEIEIMLVAPVMHQQHVGLKFAVDLRHEGFDALRW
jgi:hypothetical protein